MILLTDEEIAKAYYNALWGNDTRLSAKRRAIARAQLKKGADKIDAMVADGWWLDDIVRKIRKEASIESAG